MQIKDGLITYFQQKSLMSIKFALGANGICFIHALGIMDSLVSIFILYPLCLIYTGFESHLVTPALTVYVAFQQFPLRTVFVAATSSTSIFPVKLRDAVYTHAIREKGRHRIKAQGHGFCFFGLSHLSQLFLIE